MTSPTPNPSYSLTIRVQIPNQPGRLAAVLAALAEAGGSFGQIDLVQITRKISLRDITVYASSEEHAETLTDVARKLPDVRVLDVRDRTFTLHRGGKISIQSKIPLRGQDDLSMAYTPGVGRVCLAIAADPGRVYQYTIKGNTVAIVTDGSAVLGLGNIGPAAALPVMEGKAMLFKEFAGLDAFPVCLATQDTEEIVATVKHLAPVFGGINLEDISAPRCFEIEARLRQELDIPVFHDDQHGTAIVTLAATLNAVKLVEKSLADLRVVMNGAGAAGIAVARLLRHVGVQHITICDSRGIVSRDRDDLTAEKQALAVERGGTLAEAMVGADMFVGLSVAGAVTPAMVRSMAPQPIVFAMANPIPEILPELVEKDVAVMATGRSDYANQINNVLAFPGILRGAIDARVAQITTEMYVEAARAIASLVRPDELAPDFIIPSVFDTRVSPAVAAAVQNTARQQGLARS